jgi:hypothetical protein
MSTKELAEKISSLPPAKREEIERMIDHLFTIDDENKFGKGRKPGFAKGLIEILPGFDDPIEGMEEYM